MKIGVYISEVKDEIYQGLYQAVHHKRILSERKKDDEIFKWYTYNHLMIQWLQMKQKGHNLTEYLEKYGYCKVAVYGIGGVGKLCCDELLESETIEILYVVDRNPGGNYKGCPIVSPKNVDDRVDAVIITPIYCYLEIAKVLCEQTMAKLISLEDMITVLNEYEGQKYYG